MGLIWNPWGLLGLVAVVVCISAAWVVYGAAPRRALNRTLAVLLFLEGLLVTACDDGIGLFVSDASSYYGTAAVHSVLHIAFPFLYLGFLGVALDTPLVGPLRHRAAWPILLSGLAAAEAFRVARPDLFIAGLAEPWFAPWGLLPGPGFVWTLRISALVSLFGLVATLDSWRRTPMGPGKSRAKAYAAAFVFRDLYWVVLLLLVLPYGDPYGSVFWGIVFTQSMPLLTIAFVGVLAYGVLKTQLFDIDLKVRFAVEKSTVVAAFAFAFLLASEVAERALGFEGWAFGLGAAVAIGLVFRRVERLAGRFAGALLPGVRDTDEYRTVRKHEVYRAALDSALQDGVVTERERDVLATLATELGLSPAEVRTIERAATTAGGAA
ncbi:MAG: hypothetical protein ACT4PT_12155 [Methanobacteriota archaeon]